MAKSSGFVKEFRDFIARGNVIDLAVGVVIGAAFTKIVTSLVEGMLMPVVGLFTGRIDFTSHFYVLDKSKGIPIALAELAEFFGHVSEDLRGANPVYEVPPADRANFRKSVAALRAQLALVPAAKKARLLGLLDEIARRFR